MPCAGESLNAEEAEAAAEELQQLEAQLMDEQQLELPRAPDAALPAAPQAEQQAAAGGGWVGCARLVGWGRTGKVRRRCSSKLNPLGCWRLPMPALVSYNSFEYDAQRRQRSCLQSCPACRRRGRWRCRRARRRRRQRRQRRSGCWWRRERRASSAVCLRRLADSVPVPHSLLLVAMLLCSLLCTTMTLYTTDTSFVCAAGSHWQLLPAQWQAAARSYRATQ